MDKTRLAGKLVWLISIVSLFVFCVSSAGADEITRDDAVSIATDSLLDGTMEGKRVYIYSDLIKPGEAVTDWRQRPVYTAVEKGWFVFIDLHPLANWEHPSYYIFVNQLTGELTHYDVSCPPALLTELSEITNGRDNPLPEESAKAHDWFDAALKQVPKPPRVNRGMAHAIIISGGASAGSNHIRYWNDCSFIYKTLVQYYGYLEENITILVSDGLNPAPDRSDGSNSPADLDGDGDDDIMYPATLTYIDQAFADLADDLNTSDQLFIFTTDHGGSNGGWNAYLNLWNNEQCTDAHFAELVNALPCETVLGCFEQCYSGGMIDNLEADGRVLTSAARYDELSWAMSNLIYDEFVYYWISAVAWQDPYGTPVNADTNVDGIISMHEAFEYALANDTCNEHPQYSSTPSDLGLIVNLMGQLEGVYLRVNDIIIDDDNDGLSIGNGNGLLEFGETVELQIALKNIGQTDALDVSAALTAESSYATVINGTALFGNILSDEVVTCTEPLVLRVRQDIPDLEDLGLELQFSEEPGAANLDLEVHAPTFLVGIAELDDTAGGNGDGIPNPGETVSLTLSITNIGGANSPALTGSLTAVPDFFVTDETPRALGSIWIDQTVTEPGFTLHITNDCPESVSHYLVLDIISSADYNLHLPIGLSVGQIFTDDMESGSAGWTHYSGPGSWNDQWHIESYRNHTINGTTSWKCGGNGAGEYTDDLYSILETAPFQVPDGGFLSFWHWLDAETASGGNAYDGGLMQIKNGLVWEALEPIGGYTHTKTGAGPFNTGEPIWSGSHDWEKVEVDLGSYSGTVQLRWVFGTDGSVTEEGWYIDDIEIISPMPSGSEDSNSAVIRPMLYSLGPNPVCFSGDHFAQSGLTISYALPEQSDVNISLFDATGRLVRALVSDQVTSGIHQITWDGANSYGNQVATGAYYCRLAVGDQVSTKQISVIR